MNVSIIQIAAIAFAATAWGGGAHLTGFRPPLHRTTVMRAAEAKPIKRLKMAALPSRWDSREQGWVSPVKDQNPFGTCWAFAVNAVLETQLLRTGRGEWDLSEKNMVELNGFELGRDDGGNFDMAAAYLLRWCGAVAETNDVYRYSKAAWNANPSRSLDPALHIQNVVWVPARKDVNDNDTLKNAIMEYGGVAVSMCFDSSSTYFSGSNGAYYKSYVNWKDYGHAVEVIGWDDSYSVTNYSASCRPSGGGAWIVKNSWGASCGDHGYLYVSYYDKSFAMDYLAVFVPATASEDYTAVYGYDKHGFTYDFAQDHTQYEPFDLQAAVFTSAWNEELAAVGVCSSVMSMPYEISIYTNVTRHAATPVEGGTLACRMTGTLAFAGFTTIPLPAPVPLADGTTFSIVYRQTGTDRSVPIDCTCIDVCYPHHNFGESYFGYAGQDGEADVWYDGADTNLVDAVDYTDETWGACIKAYTRTTVATRAGDRPGEGEDGTAALADLAGTNAAAYAQHSETFGAYVNIVGANGRTLWASWLAGFDPANPDCGELEVSIAVTNGVPFLSWTPDLGVARTYTIWGHRDLSPTNGWETLLKDSLGASPNHFFKISVSQP